MAFNNSVSTDIEKVRAGERWNDEGIIYTATDFQDKLVFGRLGQMKGGILSNLDATADPLLAGIVLRSVVNPIESGSYYDASIHRECEYKRVGLATVDVATGITPTQFAKCYFVNTVGDDIGKATTSATGTLNVNAEFVMEIQAGIWLVYIDLTIPAAA